MEVFHIAPNGNTLRGYTYLRWDGWHGTTREVIERFDANNMTGPQHMTPIDWTKPIRWKNNHTAELKYFGKLPDGTDVIAYRYPNYDYWSCYVHKGGSVNQVENIPEPLLRLDAWHVVYRYVSNDLRVNVDGFKTQEEAWATVKNWPLAYQPLGVVHIQQDIIPKPEVK